MQCHEMQFNEGVASHRMVRSGLAIRHERNESMPMRKGTIDRLYGWMVEYVYGL